MEAKYNGPQASKDPRKVVDLVPQKPIPPGFASREEFEGFQWEVKNAFLQRLIPDSIKSIENAVIIALKGRELSLEPLYALSVIYLVHGKPALEGEAMLGLVLRRYPDASVQWIELSHEKAVLELARPGGKPSRFTFTVQDALRARLITKINPDGTVVAARGKEVWEQYTRKMLCWRAVSEGVTLLFPECIQGCLTPEELTPPEPVNLVDPKEIDSQFVESLPPAQKVLTIDEMVSSPGPLPSEFEERIIEPAQPAPPPPPPPRMREPGEDDVNVQEPKRDGSYLIRFGSLMGKQLKDIPIHTLKQYLMQLQKQDERAKGADAQVRELIKEISAYIL